MEAFRPAPDSLSGKRREPCGSVVPAPAIMFELLVGSVGYAGFLPQDMLIHTWQRQ